jgi:hypothetical protein
MTATYRTKTIENTWCGARAVMTTYQIKTGRAAERVVAMQWADDNPREDVKAGDLVLMHQKGDGTKGTLVNFDRTVIPGGTQENVDAYLAVKLPL